MCCCSSVSHRARAHVRCRDKLKAERERGITIDIALWKFETAKFHFTIIDTPGHRDFIKNLISGASQADVALLVVAAASGEFEAGIAVNGQTREHVLLAFTLGVQQMIVACNKMDATAPAYDQGRFDAVKGVVTDFLKNVGYSPSIIPFVPISGWEGDNMIEAAAETMSWYTGPPLIEALDNLKPPKRPLDRPLRLPIQDVYKIGGVGTVAVGRLETGVLKPGMPLRFAPSPSPSPSAGGVDYECGAVEMHQQQLAQAVAGDQVGFSLLTSSDDAADSEITAGGIQRGSVASNPGWYPAKQVAEFLGHIILFNTASPVSAGYTPMLHCHNAYIPCKFASIHAKIERRGGKVIEEDPQTVSSGDTFLATLVPTKPMCVEPFADYPPLGRFVVRELRQTVAVGVVKKITTTPA